MCIRDSIKRGQKILLLVPESGRFSYGTVLLTCLLYTSTLFVQQGVEETTMVAIAEAVGCSRRTVYTYYKDKQALLMAVIDVYKRQLEERLPLDCCIVA